MRSWLRRSALRSRCGRLHGSAYYGLDPSSEQRRDQDRTHWLMRRRAPAGTRAHPTPRTRSSSAPHLRRCSNSAAWSRCMPQPLRGKPAPCCCSVAPSLASRRSLRTVMRRWPTTSRAWCWTPTVGPKCCQRSLPAAMGANAGQDGPAGPGRRTDEAAEKVRSNLEKYWRRTERYCAEAQHTAAGIASHRRQIALPKHTRVIRLPRLPLERRRNAAWVPAGLRPAVLRCETRPLP